MPIAVKLTPRTKLLAAVSLMLVVLTGPLSAQSTADAISLLNDVRFLSDDKLEGRMIGSPGADRAAAYLARRFKKVGLIPSPGGWFQNFTVSRDAPAAAHAGIGGVAGKNVIGVLPGRDPKLRDEIILVGAHYDHLGRGGFGSLDPDSTGKVHNGADDNASGAASLIHIARRLAVQPPARTVVFVAFSGEEEGLLGSAYYVRNPAFPLASVYAMINLDMVGRLRDDHLIIYGSATASEFQGLIDSLNTQSGFVITSRGDGYGPSDQSSFYGAGRPVLHIFTDLHEDYHRTTDDWDKINADGLAKVADFTTELVRALASRPGPLNFVSKAAPTDSGPPPVTPGYGAYLGTVPDMSESPGGVRLTGVRAGSPAEKAGLRGSDVIVSIGGMATPDLQAMTNALRAHKAGDVVDVRYVRGGVEQTVSVTLGTRGS
ncbi:MAG TPA: M28 family peptidase [Gemmatimonadales bacterium]|nr:M28 family peptidase [Gemmatimonadales bacterium]